jgi:hypothetical protein
MAHIIRSNSLTLSTTDRNLPVIGYQNYVTLNNISTNSEDTDFPITNLANPATHLKWKSTIVTGDEFIYVNGLQANTVNYVAIAGHNIGSQAGYVTIYGTTDPDSPFDSPGLTEICQQTNLTDDSPYIFQFVSATWNTIAVRIEGDVDIKSIAVLYVGNLMQFERSIKVDIEHNPINLNRHAEVVNGFSESGQFLGRIVRNESFDTKAEFTNFTNSWYRNTFMTFADSATENPFFFAWAPYSYSDDVGFCWLTKDIDSRLSTNTERFSTVVEMRGLV